MKTQVLMKRELFGSEIEQQSKTGFFNATDLVKIGNKWRNSRNLPIFNFSAFLNNGKTKEFIEELNNKYDIVISKGKSKNSKTWVHPLLFIDIALAINPKLKVEVYEWLFDNLIKFRNDSGDSYKEMSAAIWQRFQNKREFPKYITRIANYIRKSCDVTDWNNASEEQLKLRDKIHYSIKTLTNVLTSTDEAVRLGVKENIDTRSLRS
ncbi:MAG: KilA-N domain-containing protein [Aureibaculum sp.]|nr:KilA-N domain-containing protein [Aureibaculum sp.]